VLCLDQDEYSFALFRDEASDDLLRNILRRIIQQFFELVAGEAMNDFVLPPNRIRVRLIELVEAPLFLVHILYEAASAISHLAEAVGQSALHMVGDAVSLLAVRLLVGHVPDVVRNELLHALALISINVVLSNLSQSL